MIVDKLVFCALKDIAKAENDAFLQVVENVINEHVSPPIDIFEKLHDREKSFEVQSAKMGFIKMQKHASFEYERASKSIFIQHRGEWCIFFEYLYLKTRNAHKIQEAVIALNKHFAHYD
jgi:hypothetical protein